MPDRKSRKPRKPGKKTAPAALHPGMRMGSRETWERMLPERKDQP